jgi:hypothetical protein
MIRTGDNKNINVVCVGQVKLPSAALGVCQVSQHGQLLGRRGCILPANAGGFDTHRDAITCRGCLGQVACGGFHTAVVTLDGRVWTWGEGKHGQLGYPSIGKSELPQVLKQLP